MSGRRPGRDRGAPPAADDRATVGLDRDDMPEVHVSADAISLRGQRHYVRGTAAELGLVVLAALFAWLGSHALIETWETNWLRFGAAAAFLLTAFVKLNLLSGDARTRWNDGRAVAESAKTLAWRYAVGGDPFGLDPQPEGETAERLFHYRLRESMNSIDRGVVLPDPERTDQITQGMRELRGRPLEERRRTYLAARLDEQRRWYASKAHANQVSTDRWNWLLLAFQALGGIAALISAMESRWVFQFEGVAAAALGAIVAWTQTKQHDQLAESYAIAARELAEIMSLADTPDSEESWATFVGEAEKAISREHTLWQAARGGESPGQRLGFA